MISQRIIRYVYLFIIEGTRKYIIDIYVSKSNLHSNELAIT